MMTLRKFKSKDGLHVRLPATKTLHLVCIPFFLACTVNHSDDCISGFLFHLRQVARHSQRREKWGKYHIEQNYHHHYRHDEDDHYRTSLPPLVPVIMKAEARRL